MTDPLDEPVYVVARSQLFTAGAWRGVRAGDPDGLLPVIARDGRFVARGAAERDPSLKQIIPYLVLRDGARIFLMRRTRAGADERLHDRYSIGVGGHVNPEDGDVEGGLRREWREELEADFEPAFSFVGLLNDDETDVGSVHLGLVFVADAAGRPVAVREREKLSGSFADPGELREVYPRMESWSQLALDALDGAAGSPPEAERPA